MTTLYDKLKSNKEYLQDPKKVYVCVRKRQPFTSLVERIGPFSSKKGIEEMVKAIEKYGPSHKVVIEPIEYRNHNERKN